MSDCTFCGTPFQRRRGNTSGLCCAECRLWSKVDRTEGCWFWTGALSSDGYGHLKSEGGRVVVAHRMSYELLVGPIPEGLQLDHLCRVRRCVNPEHLEPVTNRENVHRGMKGYHNRTTCKHGHDITDPENVYTYPTTGIRNCRQCMRDQARKSVRT